MKPKHNDIHLEMKANDIILEVASAYNDVTTSDLQGMAGAAAIKIISLARSEMTLHCGTCDATMLCSANAKGVITSNHRGF